jgi:hypothetical protein
MIGTVTVNHDNGAVSVPSRPKTAVEQKLPVHGPVGHSGGGGEGGGGTPQPVKNLYTGGVNDPRNACWSGFRGVVKKLYTVKEFYIRGDGTKKGEWIAPFPRVLPDAAADR